MFFYLFIFRTRSYRYEITLQWKQNPRFGECSTCFGYETKTGVLRILVIFQHGPMFSHINGKLSPRPFQ